MYLFKMLKEVHAYQVSLNFDVDMCVTVNSVVNYFVISPRSKYILDTTSVYRFVQPELNLRNPGIICLFLSL